MFLSTKLQNLNENHTCVQLLLYLCNPKNNNMKYDSPYFEFIDNNHPQYYSDDPSFFLNDLMTNDLNDHFSNAPPRSLSILNFHSRNIKF